MKESISKQFTVLKGLSRFNPVYSIRYERFVKDLEKALKEDVENSEFYNSLASDLDDEFLNTSAGEIRMMCTIVNKFKYQGIRVNLDYFVRLQQKLNNSYKKLSGGTIGVGDFRESLQRLSEYRQNSLEEYWDYLTYLMFSLLCSRKYGQQHIGKRDVAALKKEITAVSELSISLLAEVYQGYSVENVLTDEEFIDWAFIQFICGDLSDSAVAEKMQELLIIGGSSVQSVLVHRDLFRFVAFLRREDSVLSVLPFILNNPDCIPFLEADVAALVKEKIGQIFYNLADDHIFSYALCSLWSRISFVADRSAAESEVQGVASFLESNGLVPAGVKIDFNFVKRFVCE